MSSPRVLIVGCGVAGPVLAVLLKQRGYDPVVYEKVRQLGDAGASLMLMPNGMKVLNLVGLTTDIYATALPIEAYEDFKADGTLLGSSALPSMYKQKYSESATGVRRTELNLKLKNLLIKHDIEIYEGHELSKVSLNAQNVTASFTNGQSANGDFIVGCDGLKSALRQLLLDAREVLQTPPTFTGLTQTSGISPMPAKFTTRSMRNYYGNAVHVIAYPLSSTQMSWAITLPETDEAKESWKLYDQKEMQEVKKDLAQRLHGFEPSVLEMIGTAERMLKFGLFDRQELKIEEWYTSRAVLIGDAAHPTSPHLGQGANQALEDCYHLSQALPDLTTNSQVDDIGPHLQEIFAAFAQKRQPRTSTLVRGARVIGNKRVVTGGKQDCEIRDQNVIAEWKDTEAVVAKYDALCREPFEQPVMT